METPTKSTAATTQNKNNARKPGSRSGGGRKPGGRRPGGRRREPREFEQKILDLARVTRVTAGGKRMRFRCTLVIGDKKGRVGIGTSKGTDVAMSIEKAYKQAKRNVITVKLQDETIPHRIDAKYGAAKVLLKPAPKGTGLKAGGAIRVVLEMAGVPNAVSKIMGSKNKINIARAALAGLRDLRSKKNA